MSMPQYIEIAVVASTEEQLKPLIKGAKIRQPSVAPKYLLLSLRKPSSKKVLYFSDLNPDHVLYWIAINDEAFCATS